MVQDMDTDELIHQLHNITTQQLNITNQKLAGIENSIDGVSWAIWCVFVLIPIAFGVIFWLWVGISWG